MKKNKWLIGIGIGFLLCVIAVGVCKNRVKMVDGNIIRIGAILPLTGTASFYGESGRRGIELACKMFEQVHPDIRVDTHLMDDKGVIRDGLSAANQLKSLGCIYVVGPMMSGVAAAVVAAHKNEKDFVFLLPTATTPGLRGFAKNVFRTCMSDDAEGATVADYVCDVLGSTNNIAVLHLNNEYGLGVANAFVSRLQRYKMKPSIVEGYDAQDSNVRIKVLKVLSHRPDGVFLVGQKEQKVVIKKLKEHGFNGKILGTTMFEDPDILSLKEIVGAIYSSRVLQNGKDGNPPHPFYELYKNVYNEEANYYAASCFDSATCALEFAAELKQREDKSPVMIPFVVSLPNGATGSLQFDDKNDVNQSFVMKVVCDDGSQKIILK